MLRTHLWTTANKKYFDAIESHENFMSGISSLN